ncbi:unnamed protein product, partial [marine sediment metagenome]
MLPFKGKYGEASVLIDEIAPSTIKQIYEFLNHPAFTNPIAIMPDAHKGNGVVIGFTMEMTDKVIPNVIGVDIGCGMLSMDMGNVNILADISRADLDYLIRQAVPFGTNVRKEAVSTEWKSTAYGMTVMSYYLNKKYNIMNPGKPIVAGDGKMPPEMNTQTRGLKWIEKKCKQIG